MGVLFYNMEICDLGLKGSPLEVIQDEDWESPEQINTEILWVKSGNVSWIELWDWQVKAATELEKGSGQGKMEQGKRLKQATLWWTGTAEGSSADSSTTEY